MPLKYCPVCKLYRTRAKFSFHKGRPDKKAWLCKDCAHVSYKRFYDKIRVRKEGWKPKTSTEYAHTYHSNNPWAHFRSNIRRRCEDSRVEAFRYYGAKGIKCLLSTADLKTLWIRDNAAAMIEPSVDRIDNLGNYTLENCRFLELRENIARRWNNVPSQVV